MVSKKSLESKVTKTNNERKAEVKDYSKGVESSA